ncbi:RluA family pseudouridine synthase [Leptolyngbya sp. 7M]|uniref:RluA family pseudouridine synthase n=1 Tax=Leptolyngbya sp. 7M TaxID=2812896 RepID=UPI001B8D94E5|nr:RluA family pseudouridine synthase [Leptolyngbya sp. 7M]QYO66035.1 RluA family pseudouridine synthase [Leptolyngbya sp. 7M]
MDERLELIVETGVNKIRLDEYLFERFAGLSKMYLRRIVKTGKCEVNGRHENVGFRLRPNDFIEIELDRTRETAMLPQDIPIDVVYEDEWLLAINKPAGMLVHPNNRDKSGTLLNALSYYLNHGGYAIRPGLIHRLDKDTSGLLVVSKNAKAHQRMMEAFRRKYVQKRYLALVSGRLAEDHGVIEAPIGRHGDRKLWDIKDDGKASVTRFNVLERSNDRTLLELEPVTGRTNQLRIHCAHIGHPILGDVDRSGPAFKRLCLHSWKLQFRHPMTRQDLRLVCEPDHTFDQRIS